MRAIPRLYRFIVLVIVIVPFLATVLAIVLLWKQAVHWSDLVLLATMYSLVALCVTVGYHRMLSHRSFRPHPVVKCCLLILGSMAFERPALEWAETRLKHHAQSR